MEERVQHQSKTPANRKAKTKRILDENNNQRTTGGMQRFATSAYLATLFKVKLDLVLLVVL